MPSSTNFLIKMQNTIGMPTRIEQDPRAGFRAVWGSRETGAFAIERGPVDRSYEVILVPVSTSNYTIEKHTMTPEELNKWFDENIAVVKEVLAGH